MLGTWLAVEACLPALRADRRRRASSTFSGGGATAPLPRVDAYAASKAGIVRLTENLAPDWPRTGSASTRSPPASWPRASTTSCSPPGPSARARCCRAPSASSPRAACPREASAELAVFLLSADARGISGKLISAEWDPWRDAEFRARLAADPDLATLRRIDDQLYRRVQ